MKWKKRNPALNTVEEVVMANHPYLTTEEFLNDPREYQIEGIDKVVEKIHEAKKNGTFITVVGDYDADGVTSSSGWEYILNELDIKHRIRLPDRHKEGYGLSESIIDEIDEGIVITVDNGIAALHAIKKAKDKGLYVIIVDHHKPVLDDTGKIVLPPADIIIDPHAILGQADFLYYCGAGLTYKIAQKLFDADSNVLKKISCFAAIGTIADVVSLTGDNRKIVKEGLSNMMIFRNRTTGLGKLMDAFYINGRITATDIGFSIGPALNACGRLGAPIAPEGAEQARKLLCFNGSLDSASVAAMDLVTVNKERQRLVKEADRMAERIIEEEAMYGEAPLILTIPDINEGLIGIIAGHLTEKYGVPSIVFTNSSKDMNILKGSGRSVEAVDLKALLDTCKDDLIAYGGHPGAAGLSIEAKKLDEFRMHMQENIGDFDFAPEELMYDIEIDESEIESTIAELDKFGPYGNGNPEPIFLIRNYSLYPKDSMMYKVSGSDSEHVRFFGKSTYANAFFQNEKYIQIGQPKILNLIGTLDTSCFKGVMSYGINVEDMEPVKEKEKTRTPLAELIRQRTLQINTEKGL